MAVSQVRLGCRFHSKRTRVILVVASILLTTVFVAINEPPTRSVDQKTLGQFLSSSSEFLHRLRGPLSADDPKVLSELLSRHLIPPSTLPYNLSDPTGRGTTKFSWPFIHKHVSHFFDEQNGGFFVEAGALNGEFLSNTLWLELYRNWTGLLVEPTPVTFKYLTWKRRRAWISNTCLSTTTYPRQAVFEAVTQWKDGVGYPWVYRAETFEINPSGAGNFDWILGSWRQSYTASQCFPLWSYLLTLNRTTVDFLSLDTQGGEWDILKTIPWDKVKIRSLVVEHYPQRQKYKYDPAFVNYMENTGYILVDCDIDPNYFFVLKNDSVLERRTRLLKVADNGISCEKKLEMKDNKRKKERVHIPK